MRIKAFIHNIRFLLALNRIQTIEKGVASRIPRTLAHILMLDYDGISLEVLKDELEQLMEACQLGDIHIIESSEGNYHVECHDHFGFAEVLEIQNLSSCDLHFKRGPTFNQTRSWYHRRSKKRGKDVPKYIEMMHSPFSGERLQSSYHTATLERDFGVIIELSNPDGNDMGYEDEYETMRG